MKTRIVVALGVVAVVGMLPMLGAVQPAWGAAAESDDDPFAAKEAKAEPARPIADPLQPVNRAFFVFNDKLYFWLLKPVARGYNAVMPEKGRVGVRNFFSNVTTPIRTVNCLLQGDLKGSGTELARFGINTTVGILGFGDPAKLRYDIQRRDEDLGQTLGVYGMGTWLYINWPIFGPSCPRDTVGMVADAFLDPASYTGRAAPVIGVYKRVNTTSLSLGDYEDLKEAALDPYIALRDAYNQHRRHAIALRR